jgi:hypothetical protein
MRNQSLWIRSSLVESVHTWAVLATIIPMLTVLASSAGAARISICKQAPGKDCIGAPTIPELVLNVSNESSVNGRGGSFFLGEFVNGELVLCDGFPLPNNAGKHFPIQG